MVPINQRELYACFPKIPQPSCSQYREEFKPINDVLESVANVVMHRPAQKGLLGLREEQTGRDQVMSVAKGSW